MLLTTQISEYEMDHVVLDLGSDMNVLPKQTWECMGRPVLQWSPIRLWMENQQKIVPMGRLQGVTMDIDSASTQTDFEVIKIVDDSNLYPTLLGIEWAMDMNGVINLKKRKMIFEKMSLRIVIPLDPDEGVNYTKLVHEDDRDDELDCTYQITVQDQDQVNPTEDGRISWECDSSCNLDFDEEIEHWQNWLHEVLMLNFNRKIRSLWYVTTEAKELPTYYGDKGGDELLNEIGRSRPKQQQCNMMDWALCVVPTQRQQKHQQNIESWHG